MPKLLSIFKQFCRNKFNQAQRALTDAEMLSALKLHVNESKIKKIQTGYFNPQKGLMAPHAIMVDQKCERKRGCRTVKIKNLEAG